jgi:hypothetical protein
VVACSSRPTPSPLVVPDQQDSCRLSADSTKHHDTLTVVLSEPVDIAHAKHPTNDSERLVFRELFETLIYIDCRGEVRPGLAETWEPDASGRIWTFRLRDDGPPAGTSSAAVAVVSSWRVHPEVLTTSGIESAAALRDGRLTVTLRSPEDSVPRILADPMLSVVHSRGSTLGRADRYLITRPRSALAPTEFRVEPDSDPRDALDAGADMLVTRDPRLVDYGSSRGEFTPFPLPWSRTYVLVHSGEQLAEMTVDVSALSVRSSLARDAVPASARAAEPPYWWIDRAQCPDTARTPSGTRSSRVVYDKDDDVARRLAERVVALARTGSALRAVGLETEAFARAVEGGSDRAYVVGLPRQSMVPCRDAFRWPAGARVLPLIDTRAYAIVRKGAPPLTVDWDGTIRLLER